MKIINIIGVFVFSWCKVDNVVKWKVWDGVIISGKLMEGNLLVISIMSFCKNLWIFKYYKPYKVLYDLWYF